jgi:hypothetical protein
MIAAMNLASGVLENFRTVVLSVLAASTTGGRFHQVAYRRVLETGSVPGADGYFSVAAPSVRLGRPFFGGPDVIRDIDVVIDVLYFRSADRRTSQRNGWQDLARIGDLCENPVNGNWASTGIRSVTKWGCLETKTLPQAELWTARFVAEWQQPGAYPGA